MPEHSRRNAVARKPIESRRSGGPSIPRLVRRGIRTTSLGLILRRPTLAITHGHASEFNQRIHNNATYVTLSSILLGVTTGMVVAGVSLKATTALTAMETPRAFHQDMFIAITLLVLACGARLPRGFALWISAKAWRRFATRKHPDNGVLLHVSDSDPAFRWIVLSAIALLAGVLIAALPVIISVVSASYGWMSMRFLWSAVPLSILDACTLGAMCGPALLPLGLAMCCAHRISRVDARWDPRVTGSLLLGVGVGVFVVSAICRSGRRPDLLLVAAALPALATALLGALRSSSAAHVADSGANPESVALPEWCDRWPGLLRATIVALAVGGAAAMYAFAGQMLGGSGTPSVAVAWLLAALGGGVVAGCYVRSNSVRSIGGLGVACAVAGLILIASSVGGNASQSGQTELRLIPACASMLSLGIAIAYGWKVLMNRVSGMALAGAALFSRVMVCAAISVWIGFPLVRAWLGTSATLLMIALSFLALGGALIIHEPKYSPRTRRARLGTIFASIATMILAAWIMPHWWHRRKRLQQSAIAVPREARSLSDAMLEQFGDQPGQSTHQQTTQNKRGSPESQ